VCRYHLHEPRQAALVGAGHVLVDNRASARGGWERKGGRVIHHVAAERSIARLRELGTSG
jgi:hypothetical protein